LLDTWRTDASGTITLNEGREAITLMVANTGDVAGWQSLSFR
jgi:urease beta subunit